MAFIFVYTIYVNIIAFNVGEKNFYLNVSQKIEWIYAASFALSQSSLFFFDKTGFMKK